MNGFWSWETLGVVLTLIGVFFGVTVGFVVVVSLAIALLSTLVIFTVPKRWKEAIVRATSAFWPEHLRQKYGAASSATDPTCGVTISETESASLDQPERFGSLNRVPELQGRRLLGVQGFSQKNVQDIEEDTSVWLLEFEGGLWAELVIQIAPSWISPTFQLAWDVYAPTIAKPAMADHRIAHLPRALGALIGARFLREDSCVSTELMALENRLIFEVQAQDGAEDVLVLRLGYLKAAEDYLRTGKVNGLGNQGLDAQVVSLSGLASN